MNSSLARPIGVEQERRIVSLSNLQRIGLLSRSVIRSDTRSTLLMKARVFAITSMVHDCGIAAR